MSDKEVIIPLTGEALDLLRKFNKELNDSLEARQNLQAEYNERLAQLSNTTTLNMREIWFKLAPMVDLDAEATWLDRAYGVETRYLDHGFGAVVYNPQMANPQNPIEALFGKQNQEEDEPVPPVDPSKLN